MKGCKNHVLITLGGKGALLLSRDNVSKPELIDSPKVEAVDTTVCLICILCVLYCVYSFHQKLKNSDRTWLFKLTRNVQVSQLSLENVYVYNY